VNCTLGKNTVVGKEGNSVKIEIKQNAMKLISYVRFEVFTAVTMKNGLFWDVTPCGSCKNRLFRGT
jgi:hypothetical protein